MQNITANYYFVIDNYNNSLCSGWYVRRDGADSTLILERMGQIITFMPTQARPDVAAAGMGSSNCGFCLQFTPPIGNGEIVRFKDVNGNLLWAERNWGGNARIDGVNDRLAPLVEPFVELDIKKVQAAMMEQCVTRRFSEMFHERLAYKNEFQFRDALVEILAEMKTTLHLLSAAYIDFARHKDPEFLKSIIAMPFQPERKIVMDVRGDITGSNWHDADDNGRWAGPGQKSSLLFPALASGKYIITFEIPELAAPGILINLSIHLNGQPLDFEVCAEKNMLSAEAEINNDDSPFMTLAFIYGAELRSPNEINPQSLDKRKISFKLKSVSFERIQEI